MQPNQIRTLLEQVRGGTVEVRTAATQLIESMRRSPFENLGFARVDHHRAIRQGFPEVIFGEGKSSNQIAEIATKIIDAGQSLLITRTNRETFETVRERVDSLVFHETARIISHDINERSRKLGNLLVISAGTADQIVAEEAVITAERLIEIQNLVRRMPVATSVVDAILRLVRSARPGNGHAEADAHIAWGPGPRASQSLMTCVRARALYEGRLAPSIDDVMALAEPILQHRMALNFAARAEGMSVRDVIATLKRDAA